MRSRLATPAIDTSRPIGFTFDGRAFTGFAGDTLASALLANGVDLVGRSFKYHRPRGILTAGSEEPNALVELRAGARREPNVKATTVELFDRLEARSQNRWPSLSFDLLSVNALLAPFFAAGFYYKTFMWPASFWERVYEPLIRRAAGLGRLAEQPDPDSYEKAFAFCDVLVIGAGPAGLAAALAACRAGARVILCDEDFRLGGRLAAERLTIGDAPAGDWAAAVLGELAGSERVTLMPRSTVFGVYDQGTYGVLERVADHLPEPPPFTPRQRLWRVAARRAVLASGAVERPIGFGANDLPGIMLAGAVRTYINRFGVTPGQRMVLFTNNDDGWKTVADAASAGIALEAVIDSRPAPPADLVAQAERAGARVYAGSQIRDALGGRRLSGIDIIGADGTPTRLSVDLLAVSGGWNPSLALLSHLGDKPVWDERRAAFVPGTCPAGLVASGAAAGDFTLASCLAGGRHAGADAAQACGFTPVADTPPEAAPETDAVAPLWRVDGSRRKIFIDFQHDVTAGDIELAQREGYRSVEHLKRYTTLGMATDQGRTANVAGLAIMASLTGRSIPEAGTTTFRPPYTSVAIAAFAGHHRGRHFRPTRLTPAHHWSVEMGASFVEAGLWLRPQWYARPGETEGSAIISREVLTVRNAVGLCDVSTLGKIDVQGADAAAFLDRVYCNRIATLPVGRARYGLMLREDGIVLDDGTVARLGNSHFLLSTTSANADRIVQHLEFCLQALWPELDVQVTGVTEHWAQLAIAGPRGRDTLRRIVDPGFDISNEAVPFLGVLPVTLCGGMPGRLFRISFSGELGYELAVPARHGDALARAIMAAGAEFGIAPYGLEALLVLRLEKAFVSSDELDGTTTARDLGLGKMMSRQKDYIGRVLAERPALQAADRPSVARLRSVDPAVPFRAGAHLMPQGVKPSAEADQGHVTSASFSPTLGAWIGLGLVKGGLTRAGERLVVHDPVRGGDVDVEICGEVFYDPREERLRA
jgi:heterotetrameric sarcosine oxidase alpha subunit